MVNIEGDELEGRLIELGRVCAPNQTTSHIIANGADTPCEPKRNEQAETHHTCRAAKQEAA